MVDAMGHVALGLLWAVPVWFVWTGRMSLVFIGFVILAALLPDVDRWIDIVVPGLVHHHGVTHTVVFVVLSSLFIGAVVVTTLRSPIERCLGSDRFDTSSLFVFVFGALLLGGLSHLFGDSLSAPDIAQQIEPFWPFFDKPYSIDVIWYNSPWWNVGLLAVAIGIHLFVAYISESIEHFSGVTGR